MVATVQLCSVHTLWLDWLFNGKRPRFVNIMGCILLVSGVFAFNFVGQYLNGPSSKFEFSILWQPGFLWSNLSILFFAAYQYCHESVLNEIPEEYVLGLLGVNMILFGWIPSLIAHFAQFETLSFPTWNVILLLVIFGATNIVADYCVMFAVRKTSAFVLSGTLALGSPVALVMTYIKNKIDGINDDVWTWWYVPTLVSILVGCILVYYGDAEVGQGGKGTVETVKETEMNITTQITLNEQGEAIKDA